ncbi:Fc.00g003060.m01.CDS01 [Cosmosporella sp. VM-42]
MATNPAHRQGQQPQGLVRAGDGSCVVPLHLIGPITIGLIQGPRVIHSAWVTALDSLCKLMISGQDRSQARVLQILDKAIAEHGTDLDRIRSLNQRLDNMNRIGSKPYESFVGDLAWFSQTATRLCGFDAGQAINSEEWPNMLQYQLDYHHPEAYKKVSYIRHLLVRLRETNAAMYTEAHLSEPLPEVEAAFALGRLRGSVADFWAWIETNSMSPYQFLQAQIQQVRDLRAPEEE